MSAINCFECHCWWLSQNTRAGYSCTGLCHWAISGEQHGFPYMLCQWGWYPSLGLYPCPSTRKGLYSSCRASLHIRWPLLMLRQPLPQNSWDQKVCFFPLLGIICRACSFDAPAVSFTSSSGSEGVCFGRKLKEGLSHVHLGLTQGFRHCCVVIFCLFLEKNLIAKTWGCLPRPFSHSKESKLFPFQNEPYYSSTSHIKSTSYVG